MTRQESQESLYSVPYHHLAHESGKGEWRVGSFFNWGYVQLALLELVKEKVKLYRPRRVLDFGCGDGRLLKELLCAGIPEAVGVDISERALAFARAFTYDYKTVKYYPSLRQIGESERPFDLIVAMEVLEHIPPEQLGITLKQLVELLRLDGILIVSVPTENIRLDNRHFQHFTIEKLEKETKNLFHMDEFQFVCRNGIGYAAIRRLVSNRFFVANWTPWLKLLTWLFRRFVMKAGAGTGAHIVAIFKRLPNAGESG